MMGFTGVALTHLSAQQNSKLPFFFSRFNFTRMKERGNTHFCFFCGGSFGFKPEKVGYLIKRADITKPTNFLEESGYNPMTEHDASHTKAVLGNAQKYQRVWDWLEREIGKKKDFPFVVHVPPVD